MDDAKFLVFEGIDGCGKSTLSRAVAEYFSATPGGSVLKVFPSHDTPIGKMIRSTFDGSFKLTRAAMLYMMISDFAQEEEVILNHLSEGRNVVCDRHPLISGFAYQGEDFSKEAIMQAHSANAWLKPTRTFIIDLPAEVAMSRWQKRNGGDNNVLFERDDFEYHERLRQRYLDYAGSHSNVDVLPGELSQEDLLQEVLRAI